MKSKEELNALKNEVEALSRKLAALTEEELAQVTGGTPFWGPFHDALITCPQCGTTQIIYESPTHCKECDFMLWDFMFQKE